MANINKELRTFHDDYVKLSNSNKVKLRNARKTNLDRLEKGLDDLNVKLRETVNQGSYSMNTMINSDSDDFDIDIGIVFDSGDISTDPYSARLMIANIFKEKGGNFKEEPRAKTNAVTISYADGYHIDFAVYRRMRLNPSVPYSYQHAGSQWMSRDPKSFKIWFNSLFEKDKQNQLKRMVRLFKFYVKANNNLDMPGGIILTALAAESFKLVGVSDVERDDLTFYNMLDYIKNRLEVFKDVQNESEKEESFLTYKDEHLDQVSNLKDLISRDIHELSIVKYDTRLDELQKVMYKFFKHDFWNENSDLKSLDSKHALNISALVTYPGKKEKVSLSEAIANAPKTGLGKGLHIDFKLESTSVDGEYIVNWYIKNTGDEAKEDGKLFIPTFNSLTAEGNTNYMGSHSMVCEIEKNGKIVAKKVIPVKVRSGKYGILPKGRPRL